MSSRKVATLINEEFKNNNVKDKSGKIISLTHQTISNYLREKFGKPIKIGKTFFLNLEQKNRVKFCDMILRRKLSGKGLLFTDEAKIDMGPYTNDHIRLSKEKAQN